MTTRSGRILTGRLRGVLAVVGLAIALVAAIGGPVAAASPAGWSSTFTPIPGVKTKSSPAAVVFGGKVWLFVRGTDNQVHLTRWRTIGWAPWTTVPGAKTTRSAPAVVVHDNQLNLIIRSRDDTLLRNRWNGTKWLGWKAVPGGMTTASAPAAVVFDGGLHLIVRQKDADTVHESILAAGSWSAWDMVNGGGKIDGAPAAATDGGLLMVVGNGVADDFLYDTHRTASTAWSGWGQNNASDTPSAAGIAVHFLTLYLFQRNADSSVSMSAWAGSGWSSFQVVDGVVTKSPPDAVQSGTHFWLFFRDTQNLVRFGIA